MVKQVEGSITEHWMDKRLREGKPINYESNLIRIDAETLLKMNELKNKLLGTNMSLYEVSKLEEGEVIR